MKSTTRSLFDSPIPNETKHTPPLSAMGENSKLGERPGEGGVGRDGDTEGGGGGIVTIGERELPEEEEEAWTTEAAEMGSGRGPHWERSGGVKKPT
ncbi:hypothetical protein CRG98_010953 [Punica granatum]|uniref:Uncharacterized protein n=1 Tax=Punica granatum TaxID=22663 RepID=A0A2I0KKG4_PUNGR|nr:hypothetical protein CRG98_010953 [Punica granatum]